MKGPVAQESVTTAPINNELSALLNRGHDIIQQSNSTITENPSKLLLRSWLNKTLKIVMSDGRVLVGTFLCTDRDGNLILGSCQEYLRTEDTVNIDEPRVLGLVMVPGRHIVQMHLDKIAN